MNRFDFIGDKISVFPNNHDSCFSILCIWSSTKAIFLGKNHVCVREGESPSKYVVEGWMEEGAHSLIVVSGMKSKRSHFEMDPVFALLSSSAYCKALFFTSTVPQGVCSK